MGRGFDRLLVRLVVILALGSYSFPGQVWADDWSLIKPDKDDGKKADKKKGGKGGKGGKEGKKGVAKGGAKVGKGKVTVEPQGDTSVPEPSHDDGLTPALHQAAGYVEMMLVDPSDDWLVDHYIELTRGIDEGPVGCLVLIGEALPSLASHDAWPVVKARILLGTGAREEALASLEAELEKPPASALVPYLIAGVLLTQDEDEKALELLEVALDSAGSGKQSFLVGRILRDIVQACVALSDVAGASTHFVLMCEESGELSEHFELILDLYSITGDDEGAIAFVGDVLASHPWPTYEKCFLNATLAELLHGAGQDAKAMAPLKKAVSSFAGGSMECSSLTDLVLSVAGEDAGLKLLLKGKQSCFFIHAAAHLEGNGQLSEALDLLGKAQKKFGSDMELFMATVDTLLRSGEVEDAVSMLRSEAKSKDADPLIVVKLAEVLFETGSRQEAIAVLSGLGEKSKNPLLHEVLEQFYDSVDEPLLAKKENELLVELVPGDPEPVIRLGERLYSEGKITEAFELWMTVTGMYEDKAEGLLRLADVLLDHMAYGQAEDAYKKALAEKDTAYSVESMRKLALYYDVVNNVAEAEKWWTAILGEPDASFGLKREAAVRIVQLWSRTYQLDKKLEVASKWFEDEPARIELGLLLANVYLEIGKAEDCRRLLTDLLERIGQAVAIASIGDRMDLLDAADHVIVTLDRLNRLQKEWADAMETFEQASMIFPEKLPELKLKVAEYALLAGKHDRAREAIDEALAQLPSDIEINEKAADLLMGIGDLDRAAGCLQIIAAKDPSRYEVRLKLSRALVHLGKWQEAADRLSALVQDCPYDDMAIEALSLLVAVVDAGHANLDLETWMFKLFMSGSDRDYVGTRLVEIYEERLRPVPGPEQVYTADPITETASGTQFPWHARAAKVSGRILVDGPSVARPAALRVLGRIRDPETATNLLKRASYLQDSHDQVMVLVAVSRSLGPGHATLLLPYLSSTSPDVVAAAVLCLAFTRDSEMLERIETFYFDPAPEVRASAVLSTGLLMSRTGEGIDQGATDKILTLLRTRQWKVTYQATAMTLGLMGGDGSKGQLMNFIASRGKMDIDNAPTASVIKSGDSGSLTLRLALLALAAGSFEGPEVTASLMDGCWSSDVEVRESAGFALLVHMQKPGLTMRPLPASIPITQSSKQGRFRVAEVLATFAHVPGYTWKADEIEAMLDLLSDALDARLAMHLSVSGMDGDAVRDVDETLAVFSGSAEGITWLPFSDHVPAGGEARVEILVAGLLAQRIPTFDAIMAAVMEGPAATRESAAVTLMTLLGRLGGTTPPCAVASLVASGEEDQALTLLGISTLGSFDSPGSVEIMAGLLPVSVWNVRIAIVDALARMSCTEAGALLEVIAAKDGSPAVRQQAMEHLSTAA